LSESLPETGWGTVKPPPLDFDDGYAAFALFTFGFLLFVPWIMALFYWKSPNSVARVAAMLSAVMLPISVLFVIFFHHSQS
jgi:hypothetical protein